MKKILPPKHSLKFLRWFCREDYIEEIEGDLTEIFEKEVERSPSKAKINFAWSVIKHFRPSFIKSIGTGQSINPTLMFRHNLLISYRNIKRYKGSFFLNLVGLSTGLACAILIYLWVSDEFRIDRFHENDARLYQVLKVGSDDDGTIYTSEQTPILMNQTMREDLPEVEYSAAVIRRDYGVASVNRENIKARPQFVTRDFFNVFSFNLVDGDKAKVLTDRNSVLLTDKMALKLFNTTEGLIGKTIEWEWWEAFNGPYTIAGIVEDPGSKSTMQFDILFLDELWLERNQRDGVWYSNNANTYLVLKEGTDVSAFGEKIKEYSRKKLVQLHGTEGLKYEGTLLLQRYSDRYLHSKYENGVQSGGKIQYVKLFSIIGIFILVIACINFMNLATAQASRRVKEVGVKKAIGARRSALITQYIAESILIALVSLMVAIGLVYLLLPQFRIVTGKDLSFHFDPNLLLAIALITLATGIFSGSYPALYLSGFNPVSILKGLHRAWGDTWVRKGLVVCQFFLSMLLIVSVVLVYKQIEFIQNMNLGFNKDNVIRITNEGKVRKDPITFLNEVRRMPGVLYAAGMSGDLVGNHGGGGGIDWEGKDPKAGIQFNGLYFGNELIEMLGLTMVEGKTFSSESTPGIKKVIFNETAIKMMGLKDPVGQKVKMWGEEREIAGVVKDFHYESLYENVGPLFLRHEEDKNSNTMVKIKAGMERETLARIEKFYKEYNNDQPFEYQFLDQDFQTLYAAENRVAILSWYFAAIAILISCLGLFGLTAFTAERRAKEISIRKILGLGQMGIVYLLSKDFTKIVLLAIVLAVPVSYYAGQKWIQAFAYHIEIEWWYFAAPAAVALLIAWFTIGIQSIKAAKVNPTAVLKSE